jgi:hypothetical protein
MPIQADTMLACQDCLDVMLTGVLNTVEVTYPKMIEQGSGGSKVITASDARLKPLMRAAGSKNVGWLGYSAAEAALVQPGPELRARQDRRRNLDLTTGLPGHEKGPPAR